MKTQESIQSKINTLLTNFWKLIGQLIINLGAYSV